MRIKYLGENSPFTDPIDGHTINLIQNYIYEMAGIIKNNDTKEIEYICFNSDIMIPYDKEKWQIL